MHAHILYKNYGEIYGKTIKLLYDGDKEMVAFHPNLIKTLYVHKSVTKVKEYPIVLMIKSIQVHLKKKIYITCFMGMYKNNGHGIIDVISNTNSAEIILL